MTIDPALILNYVRDGLQVVNEAFEYVFLNQAAARHGGTTPEALIGRRMADAYPGIDHTPMFAHLQTVMTDGGSRSLLNEFTLPDGHKRWFELRMSRIPDGVLILSVDVTSRMEEERRAARVQRLNAVGELAGGIAHDFNNLLTIIENYTGFVSRSFPHDDPRRSDLDKVHRAVARGADLTKRLLTFARLAPGEPVVVDVVAAVRALNELLHRALGENIAISVKTAVRAAPTFIDPAALDQVLMNLSVNARDAMPQGGTLTFGVDVVDVGPTWSMPVAALPAGRYVAVAVTDTGDGIPPEHLERIFEPFFTTKEGRGTGLGLATCWGLATQAGGTITVYSEIGSGTTMRLYLPLVDTTEAEAADAPEVTRADPSGVATVLLVENEHTLRDIVARTLRESGCRVVEAPSGADALLLLEDIGDRVDVLVSDVMMPRMSGIELLRRARLRLPDLPVVLVTGFTPEALGLDEVLSDSVSLLTKPFTTDALMALVRRVTANRARP
jgi:PAS domain S-box-containing protein